MAYIKHLLCTPNAMTSVLASQFHTEILGAPFPSFSPRPPGGLRASPGSVGRDRQTGLLTPLAASPLSLKGSLSEVTFPSWHIPPEEAGV